MLALPITLVTGGLCGLLLLLLSIHVVRGRFATRISLGDGGDPTLVTRMRTHANFAEYVPLALLLLGLCEATGASRLLLTICGGILVVSRLSHVLGMPRTAPNPFRMFGTLGTWSVIALLSVQALLIGLGVL